MWCLLVGQILLLNRKSKQISTWRQREERINGGQTIVMWTVTKSPSQLWGSCLPCKSHTEDGFALIVGFFLFTYLRFFPCTFIICVQAFVWPVRMLCTTCMQCRDRVSSWSPLVALCLWFFCPVFQMLDYRHVRLHRLTDIYLIINIPENSRFPSWPI